MASTSTAPIKVVEKLSFKNMHVNEWLIKQCESMGIKEPTDVQYNCVPKILEDIVHSFPSELNHVFLPSTANFQAPILYAGKDVIGCAKTGTGKTLAFALPILQLLAQDPHGIFSLILTPTRELAFQIADQFKVLGKPINLKVGIIVGGRDMVQQALDMSHRPHILIATPGRLSDHIKSGQEVPLEKLKCLVLDEADRLLGGQYADQLKIILGHLPAKRQTLLFSATITDALNHLREVAMHEPYFYEDDLETLTVDNLDQRYVLCPVDVKDAYLVYVVKQWHEKHESGSVLIFTQTCRECQALSMMFSDLKMFKVAALHSMISQRERLDALQKFRSDRIKILLCTDVASRGLDIPQVDLVVNHNVPQCPKSYVHRVGRAARAGRSGSAITFVTQYDVGLLKSVESLIKCQLKELKVGHKKVCQNVAEVLVAKREAEIKLDEQNFGERREINKRKQMILEGLDPDEVQKTIERQKKRRKEQSKARVKKLKNITSLNDYSTENWVRDVVHF
uniref:RNA helicase n=1 Tax=Romanomermis culicivorax TaxID=13658 RepID=A0A915KMV5_ROMCU